MKEIEVMEYLHELFTKLTADLKGVGEKLKANAEPECPLEKGRPVVVWDDDGDRVTMDVFEEYSPESDYPYGCKNLEWRHAISPEDWLVADSPLCGFGGLGK